MDLPPNAELPEGPYLTAATISEIVLQEVSGVHSIVRMIDRVTFTTRRELGPGTGVPFQANLFVSFRAGSYEGEATLDIRPVSPSGASMSVSSVPMLLQGETIGPHSGATVTVNLNLGFEEPGLYWFDIFLNKKFVTRAPLLIEFEPGASEHHDDSTEEPAPQ